MRTWKPIPCLAGAILAITAVGLLKSPKVSAAVRAALVEVAIPSKPFLDSVSVNEVADKAMIGLDAGTLGITNITLTNLSSNDQLVTLYAPIFAPGGTCGGSFSLVSSGYKPFSVALPPFQTVSLVYPTPLTFSGASAAHACIAISKLDAPGFVQMTVSGFID